MIMIKIIRGKTAKLLRECERLRAELNEEKARANDAEAALVELADLAAAQDDAIVELAEMIVG